MINSWHKIIRSKMEKRMICNKLLEFAKKNIVMIIAFFAAIITMFFVPIDKQYLEYLRNAVNYRIKIGK